jgi:hypothetical protein
LEKIPTFEDGNQSHNEDIAEILWGPTVYCDVLCSFPDIMYFVLMTGFDPNSHVPPDPHTQLQDIVIPAVPW